MYCVAEYIHPSVYPEAKFHLWQLWQKSNGKTGQDSINYVEMSVRNVHKLLQQWFLKKQQQRKISHCRQKRTFACYAYQRLRCRDWDNFCLCKT
jgi:hypothetical protein